MPWFDKLNIDCIHGDILAMQTEAIACNVNLHLDMNYSLGKQLAAKYGAELKTAANYARQLLPNGSLELGQAIFTPLTTFPPLKGVIFFGWWTADNEFTRALIYRSLANVLRKCFENNCFSLALPLFGSGSGSMPFQNFQDTVAQVLEELNSLNRSDSFPLEELYFVSTNHDRVEQLRQRLDLLQ
ncbi:macro domain-containing protein [uncultured Desulfobulbus sp.]|uniref:macro domain-containing protein n=1 Tax=uncultured Desulfobulbus sp. TaxID=239745 RepID=UPI0029C92989|nr:macro domain-containing protein [uncultured Desulfobulbus sp.]